MQMESPEPSAKKCCSDDIRDDITIEDKAEPGLFEELLSYLQAISNPVRLEIILFIEKNPRSVKEIARHINSNYDNTKKHIDRLMKTGIIKKEAGIGEETSKGSLPVWKYSLIPGGMESLIRSLNSFSNLNLQIISEKTEECMNLCSEKFAETFKSLPSVVVLGGDDDGKRFTLFSGVTKIGRMTGESPSANPPENIALSKSYLSVTRAGSPHAIFREDKNGWYFIDFNSTNGSYINHKAVPPENPVKLLDGDIIDLGKGITRARLVFHKGSGE